MKRAAAPTAANVEPPPAHKPRPPAMSERHAHDQLPQSLRRDDRRPADRLRADRRLARPRPRLRPARRRPLDRLAAPRRRRPSILTRAPCSRDPARRRSAAIRASPSSPAPIRAARRSTVAASIRIADPTPAARFWTLGAAATEGALIDNPAQRYAFTSRRDFCAARAAASRSRSAEQARPGNWLPTSPRPLRPDPASLRHPLDTEVAPDPATFPQITKLGCA